MRNKPTNIKDIKKEKKRKEREERVRQLNKEREECFSELREEKEARDEVLAEYYGYLAEYQHSVSEGKIARQEKRLSDGSSSGFTHHQFTRLYTQVVACLPASSPCAPYFSDEEIAIRGRVHDVLKSGLREIMREIEESRKPEKVEMVKRNAIESGSVLEFRRRT